MLLILFIHNQIYRLLAFFDPYFTNRLLFDHWEAYRIHLSVSFSDVSINDSLFDIKLVFVFIFTSFKSIF